MIEWTHLQVRCHVSHINNMELIVTPRAESIRHSTARPTKRWQRRSQSISMHFTEWQTFESFRLNRNDSFISAHKRTWKGFLRTIQSKTFPGNRSKKVAWRTRLASMKMVSSRWPTWMWRFPEEDTLSMHLLPRGRSGKMRELMSSVCICRTGRRLCALHSRHSFWPKVIKIFGSFAYVSYAPPKSRAHYSFLYRQTQTPGTIRLKVEPRLSSPHPSANVLNRGWFDGAIESKRFRHSAQPV